MKSSPGISNFLEDVSSLSHSIVSLYFALITEEGFLISPCYSWNSAFSWIYLSLSPLPFTSLLLSAIFKASSENHFVILCFFFMGMVLVTASCTILWTSIHSSSGILSDLIHWIYLSLLLYNHKGLDLDCTRIVVFPTFFILSLNLEIRSSWSEPQSASGLCFADCIELLHLWMWRI